MHTNLAVKVDAILAAQNTACNGITQLPDCIERPLESIEDVDVIKCALKDSALRKQLVSTSTITCLQTAAP